MTWKGGFDPQRDPWGESMRREDPNVGVAMCLLALVTPFYVALRPRETVETWKDNR